jgi:hypothetical protein
MAPESDQKRPEIGLKIGPKLALNHPKICRNTYICVKSWNHGCMARGGHGLPKASSGPAMPYPSMPRRQAIPETHYDHFMGGLSQGGFAVNFNPFRHPTPYTYGLILDTFKDQTQRRCAFNNG